MFRRMVFGFVVVAICASAGCAHLGVHAKASANGGDAAAARRLTAIHHAQVWAPTAVAAMDMMAGPPGPGAFPPNAAITCDYVNVKSSGRSPKFHCVIPPDDQVKVKFGPDNGEVFAEVAASRLLWALGFMAERMYPVRVVCRGCPSDIHGTEIASIQRKVKGKDIETAHEVGWAWPELDLVDPAQGGAPLEQREALKLLAVLIQHTDSKPEQQRLICVGRREAEEKGEACTETVMMLHDLGQTFGHANLFNRDRVGSVNLKEWAHARIWKDPARCVANMPKSMSGTLDNPLISESGRKFLADLLVQLTDTQLHDLFAVSRFPERESPAGHPSTATIDQWVAALKQKRDEVVNHHCPGPAELHARQE